MRHVCNHTAILEPKVSVVHSVHLRIDDDGEGGGRNEMGGGRDEIIQKQRVSYVPQNS